MKKRVLPITLCLLLCCGALLGCSQTPDALRVATGDSTGTYYSFATAMSRVVTDRTGLRFELLTTGASMDNLRMVNSGKAELAIVQNDVMYYAYTGTDLFEGEKLDKFRVVASLYNEVCQIVAGGDSGIRSIGELAGKRVSVGDAGSGVEINARQILGAYGITFEDIDVVNLGFTDAAHALQTGDIDAFFCMSGVPATAVMDLATSMPITVLPIEDSYAQRLIAEYPFYSHYTIEPSVYTGVGSAVPTLAVRATLIASAKLSEDTVYDLALALLESGDTIEHEKGSELSVRSAADGISVPFHAGAARLLREAGFTVPTQ